LSESKYAHHFKLGRIQTICEIYLLIIVSFENQFLFKSNTFCLLISRPWVSQ